MQRTQLDWEQKYIISVYPGSDDDTRLMLMSHTDVVPVEDETKWNYEPFAAEISGGRVYGRGASDCKALLTCQLMAMAIMRRCLCGKTRCPSRFLPTGSRSLQPNYFAAFIMRLVACP